MVENPEIEEAWPEERDRYIHTAVQMTWNRTMFISVEGRNGLAPQTVQPGDVIPSGDVECSGRADDQVKIRGFPH
jgi:non-ribosomal peptide synthetase component F